MFHFINKSVKFCNIYKQKFSIDEQTVQQALTDADPHDQYVIAYHLIIDNKRISEGELVVINFI